MKKIILSTVAILAFGFANAQDKGGSGEGFSKGDVFLSGQVGFGSSKYTAAGNYKEDSFTFSPSVGYFVTENIALGLGLTISNSSTQATEAADKSKVNTTGFDVMGRYYFTPSNQFSVYGQLGVGYQSTKYDAADVKVNGFGVNVGPGVSYFISKNFAMEAGWGVLSYATAKADSTGAESSTDFGLNVNLNDINFGLVYKF
ncbi:porin family protein [Flavobacterium sp.]|uniref:porin family protein n=1 Tax=Flavobacterium sp. TaxID=239 RepID=UPI0026226A37|nr:porin family protein [Flavobacterium sp.]